MIATTQPIEPTDQSTNRPVPDSEQAKGRTWGPAAARVPLFSRTQVAVHAFGGLTRIALGFIFLWAFIDKLLGLGFATSSKNAWVEGSSPTFGFLSFGAAGPFKGIYGSIAGDPWADWLFMIGLLAIGSALVLGVFMNLAALSGAVLLILMWTAVLPPENNPVLDDHLVYALTLGLLASLSAGRFLGLGLRWEQTAIVRRIPALR